MILIQNASFLMEMPMTGFCHPREWICLWSRNRLCKRIPPHGGKCQDARILSQERHEIYWIHRKRLWSMFSI